MRVVSGVVAVLLASTSGSAIASPKHTGPTSSRPINPEAMTLPNLKRWYPKAFDLWQDEIPEEFYTPATKWLTEFAGTTNQMRPIIMGGEKRFAAWVCKPGYCIDNADVLIGAGRIVGVATFQRVSGEKAELLIGQPTGAELACIVRMRSDKDATSC